MQNCFYSNQLRVIDLFGLRQKALALLAMALLVVLAPARAQKLSENKEQFITDVTNMMRLTKIPSCIEVADQFGSTWGSMSAKQQEHLMGAFQHFSKNRYRAKPYYESLMRLAIEGSNSLGSDQENLTKMLFCAEQVAKKEPQANIVYFSDAARNFIINRSLYFSKFYNLRVQADKFSFEYVDTAPPSEGTIPDTIAALPPLQPSPPSKVDDWGDATSANIVAPPEPPDAKAAAMMAAGSTQPPLEGALITFPKLDLTFATGYDSTTLYGTKGTMLLRTGIFVGEGGRFDWTVAGLPAEEVYAELGHYNFPVKTYGIYSEDSKIHYDSKLLLPLDGVFEFKSAKHASPEKSQYPRFIALMSDAKYKNLGEDVDIYGGFSMVGRLLTTASLYGGDSKMTVRHNGREMYRGRAKKFVLGDTAITGGGVYSVLPRGLDSLTQASAALVYTRQPEKKIKLYANKGQFSEAPFFDSYHRTEIVSDVMIFNLDTAKFDFYTTTAKFKKPTVIESTDYYTDSRYSDVIGLGKFDPIGAVISVLPPQATGQEGMNVVTAFNVQEVVDKFAKKIPANTIKGAMMDLASQGFIAYDPVTGQAQAGNKLKHYYASMKKRKDHDYINIQSIGAPRMNASINLDSNLLFIYGVSKFSVNDSLDVTIKPKNEMLRMGRNRDFTFDGELSAGNFIVHGEGLKFNYEFYQVDLPKIDSIEIVPDAKKKTTRDRAKSASKLSGADRNVEEGGKPKLTSGVLFINKPDNKSNRIKLPQYPIFDVQATSYVYFDKPSYLNKAYDQRVYFEVPPFRVDSISGSNLAAIGFNGSFHSDGIFPDFKEKLVLMKDKVLGFEHKVPSKGYQLYGGPGKFFGNVTMSGKGLRGSGEIKYLTTSIKSKNFIFYQDSVVARGQSATMAKGTTGDTVDFPDAEVKEFEMKWATKKDTMYITNRGKTPWYMYGKKVRMNGTLALNSTGAFGHGLIKSQGSRAESPNYTFKKDRFNGRNAFFEVQSDNPVKPAFAAKNVKFDFYVEKKYAEFTPEEEGYPSNEFPYARFKTSIQKAVWDLEKQTIAMSKPAEANIETSYFYSTLPEQDSLNFMGSSALYNIKTFALTIDGVPYVRVADALVTPDSGRVVVFENAEIQPLKNAFLVIDSVNKYHRLKNANLTIKSRHEFEGDAIYQYVNAVNDTLPIKFDKFEFILADKKGKDGETIQTTKSGGVIEEEKPLKIASGVLFKGDVTMYADRPSLEFKGFVKLDLRKTDTEWLQYSTTGESKEFALDLKGATDADGQPLTNGLFMEEGINDLYGIFVKSKRTAADKEFFTTTGLMNFNSTTQEFKIGNTAKGDGKVLEGNTFSYNDSTNRLNFEGKVEFLSGAQKEFSMQASGVGTGLLDSNNYSLTAMVGITMAVPAKAWATMSKVVNERVKDIGLPEAIADRSIIAMRLAEIGGEKIGQEYVKTSNSKNVPLFTAYAPFAKAIVLSEVGLKWHKKNAAFYSTSKLGISNILGVNVNSLTDGYLEIKKGEYGDIVNLYIELSPDSWFYFGYDDTKRLAMVSSVADFNDAIAEKARPDKAVPGKYHIELGEEIEKFNFIKAFKGDYLGQAVSEADRPKPKEPEAEPSVGEEGTDKPADEENPEEDPGKKKKKSKKKKKEVKPTEGEELDPPIVKKVPTEGEEAPAEDAPAEDTPAEEAPTEEAPAKNTPSTDTPSEEKAVEDKPAMEQSKPTEEKAEKKVEKETKKDPEPEKPAEESFDAPSDNLADTAAILDSASASETDPKASKKKDKKKKKDDGQKPKDPAQEPKDTKKEEPPAEEKDGF